MEYIYVIKEISTIVRPEGATDSQFTGSGCCLFPLDPASKIQNDGYEQVDAVLKKGMWRCVLFF